MSVGRISDRFQTVGLTALENETCRLQWKGGDLLLAHLSVRGGTKDFAPQKLLTS